jgi:hypothetical protein
MGWGRGLSSELFLVVTKSHMCLSQALPTALKKVTQQSGTIHVSHSLFLCLPWEELVEGHCSMPQTAAGPNNPATKYHLCQ